jgi:hypothetical protein
MNEELVHLHPYLSKELEPLMTASWSSASVALMNPAKWKIYHGGLWKRDMERSWEEVVYDGAGDYCAVFMVVAIKDEVRSGVEGLRVLVCEGKEGGEKRAF